MMQSRLRHEVRRREEAAMQPDEATRALRKVDAVRRRTLSERRSTWFPLVLFGVLALGAAVACELGDDRAVALCWAVAGPAGGIATGAYAYRRSLRVGVAASPLPYLVTAVAILVGASLTGALSTGSARTTAPYLVVALGFLVFAWLERHPVAAVAAVVALVAAVAVVATGPVHGCAILSATLGLAFASTGLALRGRERG
jgi:hypothetical protein